MIIEDGLTGHIVSSIDEAVQAIPELLALDRNAIRNRFEQRFHVRIYHVLGSTLPWKYSFPLSACQLPRRYKKNRHRNSAKGECF
jgi:hypothetical protein